MLLKCPKCRMWKQQQKSCHPENFSIFKRSKFPVPMAMKIHFKMHRKYFLESWRGGWNRVSGQTQNVNTLHGSSSLHTAGKIRLCIGCKLQKCSEFIIQNKTDYKIFIIYTRHRIQLSWLHGSDCQCNKFIIIINFAHGPNHGVFIYTLFFCLPCIPKESTQQTEILLCACSDAFFRIPWSVGERTQGL